MAQHSQYLESKVLTAPPHRLHLMLIEGAIRFGRQAEAELNANNQVGASAPLMRVLDIVGELLAGIRQTKSELNDKLAAVYWYIFRRVSEATVHSDKEALAEVLKLLEFERETWQHVCEKLGTGSNTSTTVPAPLHLFNSANSAAPISGISLQA
jgi:flagellar secretion chaperone FliS